MSEHSLTTESAEAGQTEVEVLDPPEGQEAASADAAAEQADTARARGWVPKEEWKGKAERWASAEDWNKRYDTVMPVVQRENHKLEMALKEERAAKDRLADRVAVLEKAAQARADAGAQIEERSARADYARALEAGDHEAAAAANDKLLDLKVKAAVPRETPAATKETVNAYVKNLMDSFVSDNPAFASDEMQLLLADEVGVVKLSRPHLGPPDWLAAARERVQRLYPEKFERKRAAAPMMEMGGTPTGRSNGRTKGWADLKPEAARILDRMIEREPNLNSMGVEKARAAILKNADASQFRN